MNRLKIWLRFLRMQRLIQDQPRFSANTLDREDEFTDSNHKPYVAYIDEWM